MLINLQSCYLFCCQLSINCCTFVECLMAPKKRARGSGSATCFDRNKFVSTKVTIKHTQSLVQKVPILEHNLDIYPIHYGFVHRVITRRNGRNFVSNLRQLYYLLFKNFMLTQPNMKISKFLSEDVRYALTIKRLINYITYLILNVMIMDNLWLEILIWMKFLE